MATRPTRPPLSGLMAGNIPRPPAIAPLNQLNQSLVPLPRAPWSLDMTMGGPVPMNALRPPAIPARPVSRPAEPLPPKRPYANTRDSLMGFSRRREERGDIRGYDQERYSYDLEVQIDFGNGDVMIDRVKGLNAPHALERAYRNWGSAVSITPLGGRRIPRGATE